MQNELKLRMWLLGLAIFICVLFRPNVGAAQAISAHGDSSDTDGLSAGPADPDEINSIRSFVACLNGIPAADKTNVSATVAACIPQGCYVTVTMSPESAQGAC